MGFFGDILKTATKFIPGPIDDIIVDAGSRLLGGSGRASNRSTSRVHEALLGRRPTIPTSGSLTPVGMQQKPRLPDIDIGPFRVNPPGGGSPGVGTTMFAPGQARPAQPAGGTTLPIVGAIATAPDIETIERRDCGPGRVLAMDGLCYPKRMLPASFRMHKPAPKPVVSAADRKAIRKANSAKKRLVKLTKDAGAHASLTKPRRK